MTCCELSLHSVTERQTFICSLSTFEVKLPLRASLHQGLLGWPQEIPSTSHLHTPQESPEGHGMKPHHRRDILRARTGAVQEHHRRTRSSHGEADLLRPEVTQTERRAGTAPQSFAAPQSFPPPRAPEAERPRTAAPQPSHSPRLPPARFQPFSIPLKAGLTCCRLLCRRLPPLPPWRMLGQPERSPQLHRPQRPPGGCGTPGNGAPRPQRGQSRFSARSMPGAVVSRSGAAAAHAGRWSRGITPHGGRLPQRNYDTHRHPRAAPYALRKPRCRRLERVAAPRTAMAGAPPPSTPGGSQPPPPLQYSALLQHLVGEQRRPQVWDPNTFGGIPSPPKSKEQKMVERAMESCAFKAALACVGGAAGLGEPGGPAVPGGVGAEGEAPSVLRAHSGPWARGGVSFLPSPVEGRVLRAVCLQ